MCLHRFDWTMANVIFKARMAASARYIYCGEDTFELAVDSSCGFVLGMIRELTCTLCLIQGTSVVFWIFRK